MTTILLVEDEARLAQAINRELVKHGYTVLHADNGPAALRLHEQRQPDLILLDWMVPALDGPQVLRRLRQVSPAPVLMLTARSEQADHVIGLELGADDYLAKPFSMHELAARVRALLQRAERVRRIVSADREKHALPRTYQNLTLDPDQRRVTVNGEPIDLSPVEFDLLYLLLCNPGRVFGRTYLLETIWGKTENGRAVDHAVLQLRKKLGAAGDRIETVLGAGYRLKAA